MAFKEYSSLQDLPEHYAGLFEHASRSNLYLTKHWYANLIEHGFEKDARLHIFAVESDVDGVPEALLMTRSPAGQNGSRFAAWKPVQNTLAGLTNFQSSYASLLMAPDLPELRSTVDQLVAGIAQSSPGWHLVDLNLMSLDEAHFMMLEESFRVHGYHTFRYLYKGNWFEKITASTFEEYLAARSGSSRKAIRNYQRKLRKLEKSGNIEIVLYDNIDDIETVVQQYQEIYDDSWKEPDFFSDFMAGLLRSSAAQGSMRVVVISMDGTPAAIEVATVTGQQGVMMRIAYKQAFARDSLGSVAMMKMIEFLIERDQVSEIDFGTDDDPYKSVWVRERRERWGIVAFNKSSIRGKLYYLRFISGKTVESLKKSLVAVYRKLRGDSFADKV